jgi:hypothetical protein
MADAKGRDNWAHTSALLAHIANVNRGSKHSRIFKPQDFNPYEARGRGGMPITKESLRLLKTAFLKRRRRKDGGP